MRTRHAVFFGPVLVAVVALSGCATQIPAVDCPPPSTTDGELATVDLSWTPAEGYEEGSGECEIDIDPDVAQVWILDGPGADQRPVRVRWRAEGDYRWVIEHKETGDRREGDHFGRLVIPCGAADRSVTARPEVRSRSGDGERCLSWTYRVRVYGCEPGPRPLLCEVDPVIIIRDLR